MPKAFRESLYVVGHNPFYHGHLADTPETGLWLGRCYLERVAALVHEAVEGFYRRLAASQGLAAPRYFAEKCLPGHIPLLTHELYPEARAIFLVRDFRDMVCSVLAFNRKRGFQAFDRERVETDEECVRVVRHRVAKLYEQWRDRQVQPI